MALQTWVARFVVESGRVTEEGGKLRTFQRRRIDEPEVDLHVLAEPSGSKGDDLGAQGLEAIGRLFLEDRLSLTGGLLRALHSTHVTLLDWNRRSLPGDQVSLSVAAVVMDGPVAYLGRCGDTVVYFRHNDRLERLEPQEAAVIPLGEEGVDPDLRRFELAPGDILLAASPTLTQIVDDKLLDEMLRRGSEEALPDLYLLTRDLPSFALFAITCYEGPDEASDEVGAAMQDEVAQAVAAASRAAGLAPDSPPGTSTRTTASAVVDTASRTNGNGARNGSKGGSRQPRGASSTAPSDEVVADPLAIVDLNREVQSRDQSLNFETTQDAREDSGTALVAPPPLDISRPVVKLRNSPGGSRSDYARTTGAAPRLNLAVDQRVIFATAAVALALFIAVFMLPDLLQENRSERVASLVANSQAQLSSALAEDDPARRRQLLEETRRLAAEALRVEPENATAADLRQQAAENLSLLDAVVDLGSMTTVATMSQLVTGDVSIQRLLVANGNAYMLDEKGGRVFSLPLTGGVPQTIFQEGESYLGTPAKKPLYFTWEGSQANGRLLILDSERKLFEVPAGGQASPLPLRRTNTWDSVAGIAAYDGNLYVLDPAGDQVHRYLPAAAGFDSEPDHAISGEVDLSEAEGIGVFGDIYVYFKNGSIQRFSGGNDAGFSLAGIDRSPKTITGIEILPGGQSIYLADAGNKRVIVLGADGIFRRQLVSSDFTDIRAIGVDTTSSQLFVIVGDNLLSAPIVP